MTGPLSDVVAFVGGFILEFTAVFWAAGVTGIGSMQAVSPRIAAASSAIQAVAMVAGLGEAVRGMVGGGCFIAGYTLGSYAGVKCVAFINSEDRHA